MSILLYPRLDLLTALQLHDDMKDKSIMELCTESGVEHKNAIYTQTGGVNIEDDTLNEIAIHIRQIAKDCGYPDSKTKDNQADFDAKVAAWLFDNIKICRGEALRKDVWSFISLVLLPDVCKWRFPSFNKERLIGGIRNVFQRLWLRAYLFDLGEDKDYRWMLLHKLTEDAMVSITERPAISSNRLIAKNIGLSWVNMSNKVKQSGMIEDINREAMKYVRMMLPLVCLDSLAEVEIKKLVDDCYKKAMIASS